MRSVRSGASSIPPARGPEDGGVWLTGHADGRGACGRSAHMPGGRVSWAFQINELGEGEPGPILASHWRAAS